MTHHMTRFVLIEFLGQLRSITADCLLPNDKNGFSVVYEYSAPQGLSNDTLLAWGCGKTKVTLIYTKTQKLADFVTS